MRLTLEKASIISSRNHRRKSRNRGVTASMEIHGQTVTEEKHGRAQKRAPARAGVPFGPPSSLLVSIVSSVGLLKFFVRTCQERLPYPLQEPAAPLKNQSIGPSLAVSSAQLKRPIDALRAEYTISLKEAFSVQIT
jgi:hypothetical protein